jgi:hypothetical protein
MRNGGERVEGEDLCRWLDFLPLNYRQPPIIDFCDTTRGYDTRLGFDVINCLIGVEEDASVLCGLFWCIS